MTLDPLGLRDAMRSQRLLQNLPLSHLVPVDDDDSLYSTSPLPPMVEMNRFTWNLNADWCGNDKQKS
jgi:hypothetical protein